MSIQGTFELLRFIIGCTANDERDAIEEVIKLEGMTEQDFLCENPMQKELKPETRKASWGQLARWQCDRTSHTWQVSPVLRMQGETKRFPATKHEAHQALE